MYKHTYMYIFLCENLAYINMHLNCSLNFSITYNFWIYSENSKFLFSDKWAKAVSYMLFTIKSILLKYFNMKFMFKCIYLHNLLLYSGNMKKGKVNVNLGKISIGCISPRAGLWRLHPFINQEEQDDVDNLHSWTFEKEFLFLPKVVALLKIIIGIWEQHNFVCLKNNLVSM